MKKGLSIFVIGLILLAIFTGCSLFSPNEFEESTLTLVNDSSYNIDMISLYNGYSGASSKMIALPNILGDDEVLASGDSVIVGLTPVLHEDSSARLYIERSTDSESYGIVFTYDEGADVIVTFDPTATETWNLENAEVKVID